MGDFRLEYSPYTSKFKGNSGYILKLVFSIGSINLNYLILNFGFVKFGILISYINLSFISSGGGGNISY